jgi:FixJ family two-component response regulator
VLTKTLRHIVVGVDDDLRVRESMERLMESAGYTPLVFASGEEFLQSGTLAEAACLITDVRMPGIDGLELQRSIRLVRPQFPVIFLTAYYDEHTRRQALHEGAVAFMSKPFDTSALLSLIERAVNESRSQ